MKKTTKTALQECVRTAVHGLTLGFLGAMTLDILIRQETVRWLLLPFVVLWLWIGWRIGHEEKSAGRYAEGVRKGYQEGYRAGYHQGVQNLAREIAAEYESHTA